MNQLGSEQNPLRVAIIGSGPSAFYATEALIKSGHTVRIDMFERLPAPFGLVRNGVAPDHPKLKHTDIAEHALAALAESRIREIHVIGRRGPAQAKFTNKELRELGELADCDAVVDPADLCLNRESELELTDKANFINANNVEIFKTWASRPVSGKRRRCYFRFLESPVTLLGQSHLERLVLERNRLEGEPNRQAAKGTGQRRELSCG